MFQTDAWRTTQQPRTELNRAIRYIQSHYVTATVDCGSLILSDDLDEVLGSVDIVDGLVSLTEIKLILGY